jgi:putative FmdB family regulatory protein
MDTAVAKQVSYVRNAIFGRVSAGEYIRGGYDEQGTPLRAGSCRKPPVPAIFVPELPAQGGFLRDGGRYNLPIYEYKCAKGHEYERAEGFDAPTEQKCPTCRGPARRQISRPAVIFKGSGFYSTDNRKGASGGNGGSSSDSSSESAGPKAEAATAD